MPKRPWPPAVDQLVGDGGRDDEGDRGGPLIRRAVDRWTVGSITVLRLDDPRHGPAVEVERLERIGAAVPFAVPEVVGIEGPWLVTVRPPGLPADQPDRHGEPEALAGLVGEGLAALHRLPVSVLGPTGARGDELVDRCRRAVVDRLVDASALPPPYDRYEPARLLELLVAGRQPVDETPVVCHGWPGLDRCLVDGPRFAGFDGFESALVADRHLDLAVAHLAVASVLGAEAVFALYEGYGADPDLVRLDHHVLAAHLLGYRPDPEPEPGAALR